MGLAPARDVKILKIRDGLLNTKARRSKRKQSISGAGKVLVEGKSIPLLMYQSGLCFRTNHTTE